MSFQFEKNNFNKVPLLANMQAAQQYLNFMQRVKLELEKEERKLWAPILPDWPNEGMPLDKGVQKSG
jgi:hypothetical protein